MRVAATVQPREGGKVILRSEKAGDVLHDSDDGRGLLMPIFVQLG